MLLEDGSVMECRIKGKFRIKGLRSTNPVAVGDVVAVDPEEGTDNGLITEIAERRNYIIRKSTNLSKRVHIIAANLDQAVLLVTLAQPQTSTGFIDRFLVSAESYHIPVTMVFNKVDLYEGNELEQLEAFKELYSGIGYPCIESSARDGTGVEAVKDLLKDNITLLAGHSGVGKSTLVNAV